MLAKISLLPQAWEAHSAPVERNMAAAELVHANGQTTLKIPYAKWSIEWSVVLRDDRIVDLIPRPGGLPDGDESPYASYELAACFPSLCGGGGATAAAVAGEASEAFHGRQTAKAAEAGGRLAADVAALRSAGALLGVVVDVARRRAELVASLCRPADAGDAFSDAARALNDAPTLALTYDLAADGREGRFLALPRAAMPLTCEALAPLPADLGDAPADAAREALVGSWRRRRNLCRSFLKRYVVVDVDCLDYGSCHLLLNLKVDKRLFLCVLSVHFDAAFPAKPPQLSLREFLDDGKGPRQLPREAYKYSPRWDAQRMSQELHDHAVRQIQALFEGAPPPAPAPAPAARTGLFGSSSSSPPPAAPAPARTGLFGSSSSSPPPAK